MYGRKKCDLTCVADIAGPLRYLGIATWFAFIGYLLNRTINAMNAPRAIFTSTAISVAVVIGLDIVLVGPMGISGLALASAIGVVASTALSIVQLNRILPNFGLRRLADQQTRMMIAIAVAAAAAWACNSFASTTSRPTGEIIAPLALKTIVGALTFAVAMRALAPSVLREGADAAKSLMRRRRPKAGL